MTPRLSKRTIPVNKRKQLEVKLKKRKEQADFRLELSKSKARSKALQKLHDQELRLFTEEAFRLSDVIESIEYTPGFELNQEETADISQESLEWDNSEEAHSFLTATSKSDPYVDEIIEEILCPSPTEADLLGQVNKSRRKTSTDPEFLEDPGPVRGEYTRDPLNWPPRFPSAEPEVFSPVFSSTLSLNLLREEVFETEVAVISQGMEETNYKSRLKSVNVAERKVQQEIKQFLAADLTEGHVAQHSARLKNIKDKFDFFDDAVIELICDLDNFHMLDEPRIAALEKQQEDLLQKVVSNEKEVLEKIKQLRANQPMSHAEKEDLDLKKRQMSREDEEKKKAKTDKAKKVSIDMQDITSRSEILVENILDIKKASVLSDQDVRQHLMDSKRWESRAEDITSSKVKVDKEIIGLEVEPDAVQKLNEIVEKMKTIVKEKIAELKKVDGDRCLFSLSKSVKDLAVYPPVFKGKEGEDVYKFKEKMLEALTTNQVREKDKVEVLRKYLGGDAKKFIGEHYENIGKAFEALLDHFGLAKTTWKFKLNEFLMKNNNPPAWSSHGKERVLIIASVLEFIREAEKIAVDHKDLKKTIISDETTARLFEIIPENLIEKIQEKGDGPDTEEEVRFQNMKKVLEHQHKLAQERIQFTPNLKVNQASFNAMPDTGGRKDRWGKKVQGRKSKKDSDHDWKSKKDSDHDCAGSSTCNPDWGGLGCSELYQLSTVEERRMFFRRKLFCYCCGQNFINGKHKPLKPNQRGKPSSDRCSPEMLKLAAPTQCSNPGCRIGAALCVDHAPKNAKPELLEWLNKQNIRTTVTSIFASPFNASCKQFQNTLTSNSAKFSKQERVKLQSGDECTNLSNDGLLEYFKDDSRLSGGKKGNVLGIPKGDVAFVFCIIKGLKSGIQTFIDNGCNCCILRDGIPEKELKSCKLQNGPISIDVATGITVNATGEWGCALPLLDGKHQLVRGLTVPKVTSDMPLLQLRPVLDNIKTAQPENKDLQKIQIPEFLGGQVDMILGIQFGSVYPEPIHHLPNGLTVFKSRFLPAKPGEIACIGGPVECIHNIASTAGATFTVRYLTNFMSRISSGYAPKIDFFPTFDAEMEKKINIFADKGIPQLDEYLKNEANENNSETDLEENETSVDFQVDEEAVFKIDDFQVDNEELLDNDDFPADEDDFNTKNSGFKASTEPEDNAIDEKVFVNPNNCQVESKLDNKIISCGDCGETALYKYQSLAVQAELRKFFEQQEAGLDSTFRCLRCRDCKQCLKGAGEERKSMMQEAHQEIIRESVFIDRKLGRAVAKMPFITDPTGKLTNNTRLATKRLENVCRKYGSDPKVKEMIISSFKKLTDRGHIVLLENLPLDIQQKIKNANVSYTIPWDVAFKEGSVSTPARPVFDASSKTPGGNSLNDLLAKGQPDMVRLIDMVLGWKIGPSAFIGDIRQFYNAVLLHIDHWQFQKILLKENLDPGAKVLTAIIKTLIYGVKPVGTQCEEIIKMVAEEVSEEHPEVATLLILKRYVDDFGQSTLGKAETKDIIEKTDRVLKTINMEVKGWIESGKDPPEVASENGISAGFAGLTWFPKVDFYKLNIQSLHFGKKKRGKFPPDLIKFDQTTGISFDDFTPAKITRTNCTSVTARIFDITGLLAPLTLKLKSDLRQLISFEPSWKNPIPDHQRQIWLNNFKTIEEVRDILYLRCCIPTGAVSCKARILLLSDAADIGIILGAYVGYEMPDGSWSCDLLFGKGLLAAENWNIPQKELHGTSALSNLKVILENCLSNWISNFFAFTDSEIALCWTIYEKTKLTTFVRNRVINIRTKMGLEILHHVDGKENPTDVGTRPELITADSVRPGSVWLAGKDWMKCSMEKAKERGVIKTVEDIKLSNDKKKTFKEGIAFDTFEENDQGVFAIVKVDVTNHKKMFERQVFSSYIYPPLKRSFKAVVRITAYVLLAVAKFKRLLIKKKIERGENTKLALKAVDFPPAKFKVFNHQVRNVDPDSEEDEVSKFDLGNLQEYFGVQGLAVMAHALSSSGQLSRQEFQVKVMRLSSENLSAALENLFKKATKEVVEFNDTKVIKKIATESDGILYCNTRILESAELKAVGHLADTINIGDFTGVDFKVPVIDQHSPLALSIALHLHYVKYPHRGVETQHRMCLQFASIMRARKIFGEISMDCVYCKKLRGKYIEQVMGPLADCQITISPVFYYTLVDLWGPLKSFVPGYEKVTRSTADKPHEVYFMVFACGATGTVNVQVIEGKDTGFCLDGMNRFFSETTVPKFMFTDEEGGLVKSLKYGRVDIVDLSGTLSRQRGIFFDTVVPQGHSAHGRIEKRIHMLQQSLEQSEIRLHSRCTSLGWHTLGKLLEREVNSVPLGYLHHEAGGQNPLLRILTPNCLKLITTSDRAPVGPFTLPDSAAGIMDNIQEKYEAWYHIWCEQYLPMLMNRRKWHYQKENMKEGDIVYFKLTESKMSANWRVGKVEDVKLGQDGYVRSVVVAYKDTSSDDPADWSHRTVDRPVRNIIKLFHIEDTTLLEDIQAVFRLSVKLLEEQKLSFDNRNSETDIFDDTKAKCEDPLDVQDEDNDEPEDFSMPNFENDASKQEEAPKKTKKKKVKKTEVEKLKIDMKGWSSLSTVKNNISDKIPDASNLSGSFQEALRCCKEALFKMGFLYTVMKVDADVLSPKQDPPITMQAVVKSAQSFFNTMVHLDSDNYMQDELLICGHVGKDLGNGKDVGRVGKMADDIFNYVNLDNIFDDKIFLI